MIVPPSQSLALVSLVSFVLLVCFPFSFLRSNKITTLISLFYTIYIPTFFLLLLLTKTLLSATLIIIFFSLPPASNSPAGGENLCILI